MKNNQLMIYGAYGYAGELMVREAVAQRLRPIIAGRDAEKLKPIATELSLECRAFGVRNTGSNLQDISVLLNCAGPFSATAEPLARACLAQQIHYLDITGEIDIFRKCHALDEEARQQNVLILPGAGTDIVPTDCLAAMLKEKLPVATRIDLALSFGTNQYRHGQHHDREFRQRRVDPRGRYAESRFECLSDAENPVSE